MRNLVLSESEKKKEVVRAKVEIDCSFVSPLSAAEESSFNRKRTSAIGITYKVKQKALSFRKHCEYLHIPRANGFVVLEYSIG
jgi:hypothetical protein